MDTAPLISLKQLSKRYRIGDEDVWALQKVDLEIARGDFVAIMGTSGSGKSTLMNMLGCLDTPTSGQYFLNGRDVSKMPPAMRAEVRNKQIGFVFQAFNLLPRTTTVDNVELPMVYAGVKAAERRPRAIAALKRVGLGSRLHHLSNQLSGGQQQRVAIARALVTNPPLILADEPTGNLDSRTSLEVIALFQALGREGLTIVIVTHEPDIAAFARRVITMRDGRVLEDRRQEAKQAEVPPVAPAPQGVPTP